MTQKRKSPKAVRWEKKYKLPYTVSGSLNFNSHLIDDNPCVSFSFDYDTGIQKGDYISVVGGSNSGTIDHRQVHVARRRQSKGKEKAAFYTVKDATATTLTVTDNNGIYKVTSA